MSNINRQYQNQHLPSNSDGIDWVLKQQVERDICLLYHQLADYTYIMADLYFGSVYALPYWEYINWEGLTDPEVAFLRDGCLVMILTMAWDMIDGNGNHLGPNLDECRRHVEQLEPTNGDTTELKAIVLRALDQVGGNEADESRLFADSRWVLKRFVWGYFINTVREMPEIS